MAVCRYDVWWTISTTLALFAKSSYANITYPKVDIVFPANDKSHVFKPRYMFIARHSDTAKELQVAQHAITNQGKKLLKPTLKI